MRYGPVFIQPSGKKYWDLSSPTIKNITFPISTNDNFLLMFKTELIVTMPDMFWANDTNISGYMFIEDSYR